jgi:rhomboid protease GluP
MLALGVLGPFVEFALGLKRYLILYLVAGVGSMSIVMLAASGPDGQQMTVGASGCIMGLVGATGALMLRGWLRERALSARRRLMATLVIILMQTAFDFVIPQVSMTAHLSGALLGFTITLLLRDRPKATNLPATGGS